MKQIKRVAADEFAEHAAEYLSGDEPITVEKDGEVVGRYIPEPNGHTANGVSTIQRARKDSPEARASYDRLRQTLEDIYARTGMTEDEFADLFDLTKPFPYDV